MLHLVNETRTLSRDCFRFLLEWEAKRAMRYAYFLSILTLKVDQTESDDLSNKLVHIVRQCIRGTDVLGRMDHRLLSIMLHHTEGDHAYLIGERIRSGVQKYSLTTRNMYCGVTVSVGGACFPSHVTDSQGLLLLACEMLTRARTLGGNRVCLPGA